MFTKHEVTAMIATSIDALRARLQAKGGETAGADCDAMTRENGKFSLSEAGAQMIAEHVTPAQFALIFPASGNINPKVCKRFLQLVNALVAKTYSDTDPTTARALIALRYAGKPLTRDALHNLLTGKVRIEGVSPETRGVSIRGLDRLVGRVSSRTVETQLSRSFGLHGFCGVLGMTQTDGARSNAAVSLVSPRGWFASQFFAMLDKGTDAQVRAMLRDPGEEG